MKHSFTISSRLAGLILTLVLLLPGCTQSAPNQTEKVSVESPPVIEEKPKTDEVNQSKEPAQPSGKEVKEAEKKEEKKPSDIEKTELEEIQQLFEKLLANSEILDTSSWQTYVSPEGKYSLKYPKEWYHLNDPAMIDSEKGGLSFDTFSPLKPAFPNSYYGILGPSPGTIIIDIVAGDGLYDSKTYGKNLIFQIEDESNSKVYLSFDTTFVNGGKSIEKRYYADVYWQNKTYYCHLKADLYKLNQEDKNNDINLLKTILTTFKFVDAESK